MTDYDKVVKGIEHHLDDRTTCQGCVYSDAWPCFDAIWKDALALLKEQEATPVKRIDGKRNHFTKCGNCNADLMSGMKFCPQCGKVVKWE